MLHTTMQSIGLQHQCAFSDFTCNCRAVVVVLVAVECASGWRLFCEDVWLWVGEVIVSDRSWPARWS